VANDTVVGVVGALVIVASLALAIQAVEEDEVAPTGPPAAPDQTRWIAEDCTAMTLVWDVPPEDLEEHVQPWTPATFAGDGEFRLTAWTCGSNSVNGSDEGAQSGAAAVVAVEEPANPRNVSADTWYATPELVGGASDAVPAAFAGTGFPVTNGSASVSVDDTPLARGAEMAIDSGDGQVTANAVLSGDASEVEERSATLAPGNETFAVAYGLDAGDRQEATQAVVQSEGETWVDELGLAEEPDEALLLENLERQRSMWEADWDRTVPDEDATGNQTAPTNATAG
jgi:hypothetical protein